MPVGFQVFLADGTTVQADDTYRNLSVNEQGTAVTTTPTNAGGTVSSFVLFYRTGLTMPLLAVGGSGSAVGQTFFDAANNRWGFIITSGAVGSSVPYYIFDVPFATDPRFGLQVFNAAGQKTFDITQKYMRVNDMYQSSVSSIVNKTYDASRVYACIHMITGFRISAVAGNTQLLSTRVSAGVVTSQGLVVDGSQGIPSINETSATILVVDVTHY